MPRRLDIPKAPAAARGRATSAGSALDINSPADFSEDGEHEERAEERFISSFDGRHADEAALDAELGEHILACGGKRNIDREWGSFLNELHIALHCNGTCRKLLGEAT